MPAIALILATLALLFAVVYLPMASKSPSAKRTIIKTLPVALFALIALVTGEPTLLVAALALSALGDACLAQDGDRAFMVGLASFLLAHVAYAVLFFTTGDGMAAVSFLAIAAIAVFAFGFGAVLVSKAGPLAVPVAIYIAAIAAMGFGAASIGGAVFAGAALFMASDAILGTEKFLMAPAHPMRVPAGLAVWVLYIAGQGLILSGLIL